MFPLKDTIGSLRRPIMTYAIIAVNILVFIFQISLSGQKVVVGTQVWNGMDAFTFQFGMISARFTDSAYALSFPTAPARSSLFLPRCFCTAVGYT